MPDGPSRRAPTPGLCGLRARIDDIDASLMALLEERARLAAQAGRLKRGSGRGIVDPKREEAVLERARCSTQTFAPRAAEAVMREVIRGCRDVQSDGDVACLGPRGSFSDAAAKRAIPGATVRCEASIRDVVEAVAAGRVSYGVVPVSNTHLGEIEETTRALLAAVGRLRVRTTVEQPIVHHVLAAGPLNELRELHSKAQVFGQCTRLLDSEKEALTLEASSTSAAAMAVAEAGAEGQRRGMAAIGSEEAAKAYGLTIVRRDVGDPGDNVTRFAVIEGAV